MRPLTFGVLTSPAASSSFSRASVDHKSALDVVDALGRLGHRALLLQADDDLDLTLRHSGVAGCVLALHGRRGCRGDIQALLEMRGVPYAGPCGTAAALAFDKVRSRQLLAYHNLPVPTAVALGPGRRADERALELLGWPCMVKPRRGAHGEGISELMSPQGVRAAIEHAMDVDHEVLLERSVEGREIQVVLMDDRVLGMADVVRNPAGAITELTCPPDLPRGRRDGIENFARRATAALGLHRGVQRVDIILHPRHNERILEVEPLPSLDRDGVAARVALAAGMSYDAFIGRVIEPLVVAAPQWSQPSASPSVAMLQ